MEHGELAVAAAGVTCAGYGCQVLGKAGVGGEGGHVKVGFELRERR